MVSGGYKDAGYEYVIVDDCWSEMKRDTNGHLHPDPTRFPNGMKSLGDYVIIIKNHYKSNYISEQTKTLLSFPYIILLF